MVVGFYSTIVTITFTCQQLLLAAYLDELGYLEQYGLICGAIIAVYYFCWFILGPIFGTLSDLHGRKTLLIIGNLVASIGFFGLGLSQELIIMFLMNALLGIGAAIRVGSVIALWIQHSPQDRVGESLAYNNLLLAIGGIGGALFGLFMWTTMNEESFIVFGILLLITAVPMIFINDIGDYIAFSFADTFNSAKNYIQSFRKEFKDNFFLTKPIIQISIHWAAFAAIVSFSAFIIPIINRIREQMPDGGEIVLPLPLLIIIFILVLISCLGGLIFWGRISDSWARRPVLLIGYLGGVLMIFLTFLLFYFNWLEVFINGLIDGEPLSFSLLLLFSLSIFLAISLIPTPMAWISDQVGQKGLGKAMSLRQVLIGIGTVPGTLIGALIIGSTGIIGLLLIILLFLIISAAILL